MTNRYHEFGLRIFSGHCLRPTEAENILSAKTTFFACGSDDFDATGTRFLQAMFHLYDDNEWLIAFSQNTQVSRI